MAGSLGVNRIILEVCKQAQATKTLTKKGEPDQSFIQDLFLKIKMEKKEILPSNEKEITMLSKCVKQ